MSLAAVFSPIPATPGSPSLVSPRSTAMSRAVVCCSSSGQAKTAEGAVEVVREQTAELGGVARINDSGVRILHAARALRKVAVGK